MDLSTVQPYYAAVYQDQDKDALQTFLGKSVEWKVSFKTYSYPSDGSGFSYHASEGSGNSGKELVELFADTLWDDKARAYFATPNLPKIVEQKFSTEAKTLTVQSRGETEGDVIFRDETTFGYSKLGRLKTMQVSLITLINAPADSDQRALVMKTFSK